MYKTVRHGENSLQYTILPQHEEGSVLVKPRKSKKKGKTAAVLTITTILICGVIATAVLVPLLLTSDLVALPAAFQKYSVSSLHRSHGNRLTILAKEPYGWTKSHHTSSTQSPNPSKIAENDNTHKTKVAIMSTTTTTTTTPRPSSTKTTTTTTTAIPTKKIEPTTEKTTTVAMPEIGEGTTKPAEQKFAPDKSFARIYSSKKGEIPPGNHYIVVTTMSTVASKSHNRNEDDMILYVDTNLQSSPSPWFNQHWPFSDPSSYLKWSQYNIRDNLLLPIALGGIFITICIMVIIAAWLRRRRSSRSRRMGEPTDTKTGDKATLLKETAAASEEE